ncbi:elongation factor P hydroxylase [Alteromonas sp. SM 2104]|nr:elongation factor P hydroxylase [Alteromonas oceanisediminis]
MTRVAPHVSQFAVLPTAEVEETQCVDELITLFNQTFKALNTRLVRGAGEPIYLPADAQAHYHRIEFAHGFFNSALHEVAHWCIAGEQRRQQVDYGYWYCPDGRNDEQQQAFEQVEVKPQAIEWAFSTSAGRFFRVSTDNLAGVEPDRTAFAHKVSNALQHYLQHGFPSRAHQFIDALHTHYQTTPLTLELCLLHSKDFN